MRAAALLALLGGLALVLWLVVGREPERARSGTTPEAEPAKASAPLGERREGTPTREGANATARSGAARIETAPGASAPPPPPPELRGTLVAIDEDGIEHRGESGRIALDVGAGSRREVPVIGGRWTLGLEGEPPGAQVRFRSCVVRSAPAALEPDEPVEVSREAEPELRVRWCEAPLLHVLAHDTGLPLDEVLLFTVPTRQRGSAGTHHPGALADLARKRGSSPIRLERDADPNAGSRVLFARAKGYAWGRIEIAEDARGEHVLRLAPAGSLRIELVEYEYLYGLQIRLLSLPGGVELRAFEHDSRGAIVLNPLAIGSYAIEVREKGRVIGEASAEVVAGERASATLELGPPSERRVPLEGVLELEGLQHGTELVLHLATGQRRSLPLADMTAVGGGRYRWSAGQTVPGLHTASWFPKTVAEFEVGPEGTRDVRIVVPAERRLRVWLIDAETGRDVESEPFHFALMSPSGEAGTADSGTSPLDLWLDPTPVLLTTRSVQYEAVARWIDAGPEPRDVVLLLRRRP